MNRETLLALAERLSRLNAKIKRAIDNTGDLSAGGQAIAIAMIVTLELNLFSEAAASLRSIAEGNDNDD